MEGTLDAFPFILAQSLGKTVGEIGEMSNDEYLQWAAFHKWRESMQELARK